MSPHAVNNFVSDLVLMAQAMEKLPKVEEELGHAQRKIEHQRETIQDRELHIIDLKTQIDDLQSQLRDAEVSRDDAELRFLELDERANDVVKDMRRIQEALGGHILTLDPPKAEEPKEEAKPEAASWAETKPEPVQDQSVADPTPQTASTVATSTVQDQSSAEDSVNHSQNVSSGTTTSDSGQPKGQFSGKRYVDHPFYVNLTQWLAGGGTEEDYYWRPEAKKPAQIW